MSELPTLRKGRDVLLFYTDFEPEAPADLAGKLKHHLRPLYHRLFRKQSVSGFEIATKNLARALGEHGYTVHFDRRDLALANPSYPVGLAGYPQLVDRYDLPNPAILGPGMYDHPAINPRLMNDPRFRRYIVPCQWMHDLFAPFYSSENCIIWYASIDTEKWPDLSDRTKTVDLVIYDKIRWARDRYVPEILEPTIAAIEAKGLTYEVLRYRQHNHEMYRAALERARGMVFVCEHETQGLAYQEAMACGVPVLAWDNGYWLDPLRERFQVEPVPASSVPFFSDTECGDRFVGADDVGASLDRFWDRMSTYEPRKFVERVLSSKVSAELYAEQYFSLA